MGSGSAGARDIHNRDELRALLFLALVSTALVGASHPNHEPRALPQQHTAHPMRHHTLAAHQHLTPNHTPARHHHVVGHQGPSPLHALHNHLSTHGGGHTTHPSWSLS